MRRSKRVSFQKDVDVQEFGSHSNEDSLFYKAKINGNSLSSNETTNMEISNTGTSNSEVISDETSDMDITTSVEDAKLDQYEATYLFAHDKSVAHIKSHNDTYSTLDYAESSDHSLLMDRTLRIKNELPMRRSSRLAGKNSLDSSTSLIRKTPINKQHTVMENSRKKQSLNKSKIAKQTATDTSLNSTYQSPKRLKMDETLGFASLTADKITDVTPDLLTSTSSWLENETLLTSDTSQLSDDMGQKIEILTKIRDELAAQVELKKERIKKKKEALEKKRNKFVSPFGIEISHYVKELLSKPLDLS